MLNPNKRNTGAGIFHGIVQNANNALGSKKAKEIRTKLITFGGAGVVVGFIITAIGLGLFISTGSRFEFSGAKIAAGMIMFMFGGLIMGISGMAVAAGLQIVIAGEGAKILDIHEKCPNCGDTIDTDEAFCDKCGQPLLLTKLCDCGTQNDMASNFCKTCGKKL